MRAYFMKIKYVLLVTMNSYFNGIFMFNDNLNHQS